MCTALKNHHRKNGEDAFLRQTYCFTEFLKFKRLVKGNMGHQKSGYNQWCCVIK